MEAYASVVRKLSDESLLAGLGSGDPDAAAAFVRRFQHRVFGLTLSILRDRGAAEEAAQETFVRAWRHASVYDPRRGAVTAWLLTIARNVSINMLPSRRVDPIDPDLLSAEAIGSDGYDHEDRVVDSELLREALARVPEDQRRALTLAAFYGFTAREMSELDGLPLGTVKTRIRSAMMKLRSELAVSMTAEMRCEQVRDLAPELALDTAAGEERDAALRHLPGCPDCRRLVSELSSVVEELLLLAPVHEPPLGFESRVVRALTGHVELASVEPLPRSRRWRGVVAVAASLLLAVVVGAGAAFVGTSGDRTLAAAYLAVLREGQGSSFTAASLQGAEGRAGSVFGYEGRPSWIVVTLPEHGLREDTYRVIVVTRDGRYVALGAAILGGDHQVWGHEIPVDLRAVHQLRFVASDGRTALTATFGTASPWA